MLYRSLSSGTDVKRCYNCNPLNYCRWKNASGTAARQNVTGSSGARILVFRRRSREEGIGKEQRSHDRSHRTQSSTGNPQPANTAIMRACESGTNAWNGYFGCSSPVVSSDSAAEVTMTHKHLALRRTGFRKHPPCQYRSTKGQSGSGWMIKAL
jgi:hypothetical protein